MGHPRSSIRLFLARLILGSQLIEQEAEYVSLFLNVLVECRAETMACAGGSPQQNGPVGTARRLQTRGHFP